MASHDSETERLVSQSYTIQGPSVSRTSTNDDLDSNSFYYPWEMTKLSPGKSSPFGALFIIVNAALGAGLLAFPFAFHSAGGFIEGIAIELVSTFRSTVYTYLYS